MCGSFDGAEVPEAARLKRLLTLSRKPAMVCQVGIANRVAAPMDLHSHGHLCFFASCPLQVCQQAQRDAELHGFNQAGEIAYPPKKVFPWEQAA